MHETWEGVYLAVPPSSSVPPAFPCVGTPPAGLKLSIRPTNGAILRLVQSKLLTAIEEP
jgi:hypothetical protein